MKHMKLLLPAVICLFLFLIGCGADKSEAQRFSKVLNKQVNILDGLNSQEATVMQSLQGWAAHQAFSGGAIMTGVVTPEQSQASRMATNFRNQLSSLRASYLSLSRELSVEQLKTPYVQTVRTSLVQSLEARSRLIDELNPLLQDYAKGIVNPNLEFGHRPASIDTIVAKLGGYNQPTNNVAQSLHELRMKYSISDSELSN